MADREKQRSKLILRSKTLLPSRERGESFFGTVEEVRYSKSISVGISGASAGGMG